MKTSVLFACGKAPDALPDIDDLFAPTDFHNTEVVRHIKMTIDKIMDAMFPVSTYGSR